MKGIQGLILAVGLGIAGAMFNWAYLNSKAKEVEMVYFVGIKPEITVDRGDKLAEDHIQPVGIPKDAVGNLDDYAVLYSARQTIVGLNVWRTIPGGALVLRDDYRTPPQELAFGDAADRDRQVEERAMWVPVDTRTFVPSLVVPGDMVSFLVPRLAGRGGPTPAPKPEPDGSTTARPAPPPAGGTEIIGPFKILSLGNRLGSPDVLRAAKIPQLQENVMTVSVKVVKGELEPQAQRLYLALSSNFQQVGVLLHPRGAK